MFKIQKRSIKNKANWIKDTVVTVYLKDAKIFFLTKYTD